MTLSYEALIAAIINQTNAIGLTVREVYLAVGKKLWQRLACDARLFPLTDYSGHHIRINGARVDVVSVADKILQNPENHARLYAWPEQGATLIMEGEVA